MPHRLQLRSVLSSGWLLLVVVAILSAGCSGDDPVCEAGRCTNNRRDGGGDGGSGGRTDVAMVAPSPTQLVSIEITPADAVREALDGAIVTIPYVVNGRQRNGEMRPVTALRFTLDVETVGTIDSVNGMFRGSGVGGVARVRAFTMDGSGLSAETGLTINTRNVVRGPGVTAADLARFDSATPAADAMTTGPTLEYPLANAVMPRNVFPPRVMWTVRHMAAGTDLYRVRLARTNAVVEGYFRGDQPAWNNSWQLPRDAFAVISGTNVGSPIATTVAVLSGATVRVSAALSFRTVDAVIGGAVYYWSPPAGRIYRIHVDEGRREDFMPTPPNGACIACHALSRDGRRMVGIINHGSARPTTLAVYDVTRPLTANPPPAVFDNGPNGLLSATFSGDGQRLVIADHAGGRELRVLDGATGARVSSLMTSAPAWDPEWSWDAMRDMSAVAFSMNNGLALSTVTGDTLNAPTMIHTPSAAMGEGPVDWHPTWTPNSRFLVFQNGQSAFTSSPTGALYVIARSGGNAVRLDNLNGGAMARNNFRAVFSPYNSGGYFWVLFTTTRNYGTAQAGVVGHKQIWVAAIRNDPALPADPSEVAYYLAGQEPVTNLSPHWSPPPCRPNGTGCATGADCCSGTCGDPDTGGNRACAPPRGMCRMRGMSCSTSSDCCTGLACGPGMICDLPLPG